MIRRTKSSANVTLPPKKTYVLFSGLTSLQKRLYRSVLGKNSKDLINCLASSGSSVPPDANFLMQDKDADNNDAKNDPNDKKKKQRYTPGRQSTSTSTTQKHKVTKMTQNQLMNSLKSMKSVWISLRKIINHSYLIPNVEPQPPIEGEHLVSASGKLILLDSVLKRILPKGHRVLIFSTSTETLDILQDYCALRRWNTSRLDGSIRGSDRGDLISNFQNQSTAVTAATAATTATTTTTTTTTTNPQKRTFDQLGKAEQPVSTPIFLLSTRAAGVGITLTSADTVIFFDSDFNQAADLQAEQRCYRIGQNKTVLSLRLICRGSIEHLYYLRSVRKAALADAVMREGRFKQNMTAKEKEQSDRQYVNIIVPDEVMVGDPDGKNFINVSDQPEMVLDRVDKNGNEFYKQAPVKNVDNGVDSSAMTATIGCLMQQGVGDDFNDVDDCVRQESNPNVKKTKEDEDHEMEKKTSMLYTRDDLDWITTDGYSPCYYRKLEKIKQLKRMAKNPDGSDANIDIDDNDDDDDDVLTAEDDYRRRRIGGLSDFMESAALQSAKESRQATVYAGPAAGPLRKIDRSDNDMVTINEDENKNINNEGGESKPRKIFDPTNIPTMRLAHFQDIVTVDFDRDEAEEEQKFKNRAENILSRRSYSFGDQNTTSTNTGGQKGLGGNYSDFLAQIARENDDFGNDTQGPDSDVIVDGKRNRTSTTQHTDLSMYFSAPKKEKKGSDDDDDCGGGGSGGATKRKSLKTPANSTKSRQSGNKSSKSMQSNELEIDSDMVISLTSYFHQFVEDNAATAQKRIAFHQKWSLERKLNGSLPSLESISSVVIHGLYRPLVENILLDLSNCYDNIHVNVSQFDSFISTFFTNINPPTHLLTDTTLVNSLPSDTIPDNVYKSIYNQNFEYFNSFSYLNDFFINQKKISDEIVKSNPLLRKLTNDLIPQLCGDFCNILLLRLQSYMDKQAEYLPQVYVSTEPSVKADGETYTDMTQATKIQDVSIVTKKYQNFVLFTILIILLDNFFSEIKVLVTGLDNLAQDWYNIIPLGELLENGTTYPLGLLDRGGGDGDGGEDGDGDGGGGVINKDTPSDELTITYRSTLSTRITSHTDFTRWFYQVLINYSPEYNNITTDFAVYELDGELTKPSKKRKFLIQYENVVQMEQALQFATVYMYNGITPPIVPLEVLRSMRKINTLEDDGDDNKIQNNDQNNDQNNYNYETDDNINNIAQLHNVNGNMLIPQYILGTHRSCIFPLLQQRDEEFYFSNPSLPTTTTSTNTPTRSQSTSGDNETDQSNHVFAMGRSNGYILINFADNSGKFGRGRLFSSLQTMSPELTTTYSNLKDMKRCKLGEVVLGKISNSPNVGDGEFPGVGDVLVNNFAEKAQNMIHKYQKLHPVPQNSQLPPPNPFLPNQTHLKTEMKYIANLIVIDSNDRSKPPTLDQVKKGLEKIFAFAKLFGLVIITPKQSIYGSSDGTGDASYYAFEKLIRSLVTLFNTDCYVFQYVTPPQPQLQGGSSNGSFGNNNHNNNHNNNRGQSSYNNPQSRPQHTQNGYSNPSHSGNRQNNNNHTGAHQQRGNISNYFQRK
jgi:hypothetical protein